MIPAKPRNGGFTIPEAILAIMVILIAMTGLLKAFSYGTGYIERMGLRRLALGHLQQEFEKCRFFSHNGTYELSPLAKDAVRVLLKERHYDDDRVVEAFLTTAVSAEKVEKDLTYQDLSFSIWFEYEGVADTLSLPARFYRDK